MFLSVSCPSVIQNACDFPSITNRLPVDSFLTGWASEMVHHFVDG